MLDECNTMVSRLRSNRRETTISYTVVHTLFVYSDVDRIKLVYLLLVRSQSVGSQANLAKMASCQTVEPMFKFTFIFFFSFGIHSRIELPGRDPISLNTYVYITQSNHNITKNGPVLIGSKEQVGSNIRVWTLLAIPFEYIWRRLTIQDINDCRVVFFSREKGKQTYEPIQNNKRPENIQFLSYWTMALCYCSIILLRSVFFFLCDLFSCCWFVWRNKIHMGLAECKMRVRTLLWLNVVK